MTPAARPRRFLPRSRRALAIGALCVACATGCFSLKAPPDTSRYFVLGNEGAATLAPRSEVRFGIGPVTMPSYLEGQKLVRRSGPHAVEYVPGAFWAEDLGPSFARTLLHRTGALLGSAHGVAFPWYSTTKVDWKVPVDVLRFEAVAGGGAVLVARWSVQSVATGRTVAFAESAFEEAGGADPAQMVDALGRCVEKLAATLADAVSKAEASRPR